MPAIPTLSEKVRSNAVLGVAAFAMPTIEIVGRARSAGAAITVVEVGAMVRWSVCVPNLAFDATIEIVSPPRSG